MCGIVGESAGVTKARKGGGSGGGGSNHIVSRQRIETVLQKEEDYLVCVCVCEHV